MPIVMEKRIVFEPRDILKVRIQCGVCGGRVLTAYYAGSG